MYLPQNKSLAAINTHWAKNILCSVYPISCIVLYQWWFTGPTRQKCFTRVLQYFHQHQHVWKPWMFRILHDTLFHNILSCVMRILVLKRNCKIIFVAKNLVMSNLIYKVSHSTTSSKPSMYIVGGGGEWLMKCFSLHISEEAAFHNHYK